MSHFPKPFFKKARGLWYVEIDRKQINLGGDREEAHRQYHQLMLQPRPKSAAPRSLAAVVDAFLEWVQKHRSAETYEWYRYRLQRFCTRYPDLRTTDLRPFHVENWVDEYEFSVTSRRNYLRSVKRCLKWAAKQGYIDSSPVAHMEVPAGQRREVVVTQVDFDRMMNYVRNDALSDLMVVTWETGCRPQESLRVEARHVDLANHRWVIPKSESKTKRMVRVVYLSDKAFTITRKLMLAHPEGRLFRNLNGRPWTTDAVNCGFLAVQQRMGKEEMKRRNETVSDAEVLAFMPTLKPTRSRNGETVAKTDAELRCEARQKLTFRRATELAPRFSLYALRHSWATNALQRGIDPLTVAILMGHEDPSMLSKVYQHLSLNPVHMLDQAKRAASASG